MISRHCLKSFSYSNSFWIWSSLSVLHITCTVSRLRSRVNLQVHFKFAFGVYFLQNEEFFPKKYSKPMKPRLLLKGKYLHDTNLKRPQRRNTHSSHKHNWCIPDIYKCRAKSTLLTIFHCCAYFSILLDQNFRDEQRKQKEVDWNAIHVRYWLHSTLKFAVILL